MTAPTPRASALSRAATRCRPRRKRRRPTRSAARGKSRAGAASLQTRRQHRRPTLGRGRKRQAAPPSRAARRGAASAARPSRRPAVRPGGTTSPPVCRWLPRRSPRPLAQSLRPASSASGHPRARNRRRRRRSYRRTRRWRRSRQVRRRTVPVAGRGREAHTRRGRKSGRRAARSGAPAVRRPHPSPPPSSRERRAAGLGGRLLPARRARACRRACPPRECAPWRSSPTTPSARAGAGGATRKPPVPPRPLAARLRKWSRPARAEKAARRRRRRRRLRVQPPRHEHRQLLGALRRRSQRRPPPSDRGRGRPAAALAEPLRPWRRRGGPARCGRASGSTRPRPRGRRAGAARGERCWPLGGASRQAAAPPSQPPARGPSSRGRWRGGRAEGQALRAPTAPAAAEPQAPRRRRSGLASAGAPGRGGALVRASRNAARCARPARRSAARRASTPPFLRRETGRQSRRAVQRQSREGRRKVACRRGARGCPAV
mmetsp:Transcript_16338/g.48419  ORF Transcript_16338/g.48419 Transcript_16338/m.48419 type:complete len:489 (-) Transcript_16338:432-1898(-)